MSLYRVRFRVKTSSVLVSAVSAVMHWWRLSIDSSQPGGTSKTSAGYRVVRHDMSLLRSVMTIMGYSCWQVTCISKQSIRLHTGGADCAKLLYTLQIRVLPHIPHPVSSRPDASTPTHTHTHTYTHTLTHAPTLTHTHTHTHIHGNVLLACMPARCFAILLSSVH